MRVRTIDEIMELIAVDLPGLSKVELGVIRAYLVASRVELVLWKAEQRVLLEVDE
jgi:hypothetical protein